MEILYQNSDYVVCIKPSGVPSQQTAGCKRTMLTLLEEALQRPVWPVHRLDKPVGGLMVYACHRQAAEMLSSAIRQGSFQKEYLAVLTGKPMLPVARLEDFLYHDRNRNKTYVVKKERKGVRKAILDYETLAEKEEYTLVRVHLLTGRTHQIRAQFASRKLPLAGDGPYGGGSGPIGLWSAKLSFPEPSHGRIQTFTAPMPNTVPFSCFIEQGDF